MGHAEADWLDGVSALPREAWPGAGDHPFVSHAFLAGLESASCIHPGTGWQPRVPVIRDGQRTLAAAPAYLKTNSHGEFVFDFAWANAWQQLGLSWYPKLLVASPYTPVSGPRLLGGGENPGAGRALVQALETEVARLNLSSAHVNFCSHTDAELLRQAGWLERFDWQYHWQNDGYRDFGDFLEALRSKPRKNIRRERRKVADQGWETRWVDGTSVTESELAFLHHCYRQHFLLYGNRPVLNRDFFRHCAGRFGKDFQACLATMDGTPRAAAIFWSDQRRLYGRYWGAMVDEPDLHFEVCYYQGIERAIALGLEAFEPGAQGEHKIRRGFLPVRTRSFHYIANQRLRPAVADWLGQEARALESIRPQLDALSPFPRS